jgi:hypothetical protein
MIYSIPMPFATSLATLSIRIRKLVGDPAFWHFVVVPCSGIVHQFTRFFQHSHSSRPRKFWADRQVPDVTEHFPKEGPPYNYFGHLKHHVPRMPDCPGSDLDELVSERLTGLL